MDRSSLFSIGEFSQITGVSIGALRHYEKIGILKPAWTDPASGYRYYKLRQLQQVDFIGLLLDLDIRLNEFENYITTDPDTFDYLKLLHSGKKLIENKRLQLENKMRYIDYLEENVKKLQKTEDTFFVQDDIPANIPLWLLPCNDKIQNLNIDKAVKRILHDISPYGLSFRQHYGLIMFCNGGEKRIYYFVDLKSSSQNRIIHENIFHLPQGSYKSLEQDTWNIDAAPLIFKDLFQCPYDKIVIQTEYATAARRPQYMMSCLLPAAANTLS